MKALYAIVLAMLLLALSTAKDLNFLSQTTQAAQPKFASESQILVLNNVTLQVGEKVTSQVIDVSSFSGLSIFLKARASGIWKVETRCYYLPNGEDQNIRFEGYWLEVISTSEQPQEMTGDLYLASPRMVCDINNTGSSPADVSFYVYMFNK